jgi:hypothetical protein
LTDSPKYAKRAEKLPELVFYFYNPEDSPVEFGGAAFAAMEAQMRDLSSTLGFSPHVGVTTWSQRNFDTLYIHGHVSSISDTTLERGLWPLHMYLLARVDTRSIHERD